MTKKALVRYDPQNPDSQSSEFLVPLELEGGQQRLVSLKDGSAYQFGLVVFTGREMSSSDLFAKVVDSGQNISSVDRTTSAFNSFLEQLAKIKIGAVVELDETRQLRRAKIPSTRLGAAS